MQMRHDAACLRITQLAIPAPTIPHLCAFLSGTVYPYVCIAYARLWLVSGPSPLPVVRHRCTVLLSIETTHCIAPLARVGKQFTMDVQHIIASSDGPPLRFSTSTATISQASGQLCRGRFPTRLPVLRDGYTEVRCEAGRRHAMQGDLRLGEGTECMRDEARCVEEDGRAGDVVEA